MTKLGNFWGLGLKQLEDKKTIDLLPGTLPKKRGRPATGEAKTSAERMRLLRERRSQEGRREVSGFVSAELADALDRYVEFKDITKDEVFDRALKAFFRKR